MITALLWMAAVAGCVPVEGDRVTARDLAQADPAFSALAADTVFSLSPAPGVRRVFQAADLKRLAASHGLSLEAAAEVCVERPMVALDRERLLEAMRAALARPEARIELVDVIAFRVPRGAIEFPLGGLRRPPAGRPDAPVLWNGSVRYGAGRRYPIWAKVRILAPLVRVVAVEDLRASRPIQAGQVRLDASEGFPEAAVATSVDQVVGLAPRRAIPAGAPIPKSILAPAREVERGDAVRVEASSGRASVALPGRALSGGSRGDAVMVRNPASGRSFQARVSGRGTVSVDGREGEPR
jgi:flagella basal body P-ring formation protein FlgA